MAPHCKSIAYLVQVCVCVLLFALSYAFSKDSRHLSSVTPLVNSSSNESFWSSATDETDQVSTRHDKASTLTVKGPTSMLAITAIVLIVILTILIGLVMWMYAKKYKTNANNGLAKDEGLIKNSWNPNLSQNKSSIKGSQTKPTASDYLPASLDNESLLPSLKSGAHSLAGRSSITSRVATMKRSSWRRSSVRGSMVKDSKVKGSVMKGTLGQRSMLKGSKGSMLKASKAKGSMMKESKAKGSQIKRSPFKKRTVSKRSSRHNFTNKAVNFKLNSPRNKSKMALKKTKRTRSKHRSTELRKNTRRNKHKTKKVNTTNKHGHPHL